MAIALGLLAALLIGSGDFLAGYSARRSNAFTTTATALAAGVATTAVLAPLLGGSPGSGDLGLGVLSGVLVGVALTSMYQSMVVSSPALTSPVVAIGTALIPLAWAVTTGSRPTAVVWLGVALAMAGVLTVTVAPDLRGRIAAGVGYALLAALGFGVALTLIGEIDPARGVWSAVGQRVAAVLAVVAVTRSRSLPLRLPDTLLPRTLISGVLGSAGIVAYIAGAQRGDLATVAVAASLYPAVTAILANRLDDDVLRWWQLVGIAAVIAGIAAMGLG